MFAFNSEIQEQYIRKAQPLKVNSNSWFNPRGSRWANISKLNSFNGTTHVSTEVTENSVYPTIAIEDAAE